MRSLATPRGRVGGACLALVLAAGALGPVISNDDPIICRHGGQWHAPALVEAVRGLPGGRLVVDPSAPFRFPSWSSKRDLDPGEPAFWPLIRHGPEEVSGDTFQAPSRHHWLGTDDAGRSVAARLLHGASASLHVVVASVCLAGIIGAVLGAVAGYFGGWLDVALSRLIELVMCFPVFFLVLSLMLWLEPGLGNLCLVIGLTRWTLVARYVRAEVLRQRELDFVAAARATGAGRLRILLGHIGPNVAGPLLVSLSVVAAQSLLLEAGLSWLGFGVPLPAASWGQMLRTAFEHIRTAPHLIYPPAGALFVAVLGFNLLGDAIRDAWDPRRESGRGPFDEFRRERLALGGRPW